MATSAKTTTMPVIYPHQAAAAPLDPAPETINLSSPAASSTSVNAPTTYSPHPGDGPFSAAVIAATVVSAGGASSSKTPIPPSLLKRAKAEHDEVDSLGYHPSASEDDEARHSDSGGSSSMHGRALPASAPPLGGNALPSGALPGLLRSAHGLGSGSGPPSSRLTPVSSITTHSGLSHSGGEASASSSRSRLPLQNKTSLYRRQASAASSMSNEQMDDPLGGAQGRGSDSLSRAKSVSSVSSVNSTSSMEAVPFRAAPLGNVRIGFGGVGRVGGRNATRQRGATTTGVARQHGDTPMSAPAHASSSSHGEASADSQLSSVQSSAAAGATAFEQSQNNVPGRQRILPKGPSDEWHYRNAPGMGGRARATSHTVSPYNSTQQRAGLPQAFAAIADVDEAESDASSMPAVLQQRPLGKSSIRSKLAKRAGKLGLKPLTSVQQSNSSSNNNSGEATPMMDNGKDSTVVIDDANVAAALLAEQRTSPETSFRGAAKTYFSNSGGSSSNLAAFLGVSPDSDATRNTSSVTNAPLVVPKHPPGPPGTGPPPSPGLVGPLGAFMLPFSPVSRVSPDEQPDMHTFIAQLDEAGKEEQEPRLQVDTPLLLGSGVDAMRDVMLASSSNRGSFGSTGRPMSRDSDVGAAASMLTPAQQIQMEARAGVAVVPSEPSGASPGPTLEDSEQADLLAISPRRPASTQLPVIAKPNQAALQRWSGSPLGMNKGSSSPLRPGLLRALTSESFGRLSLSTNKDDARATDAGRSPRRRSGSASPHNSSTPSMLSSISASIQLPPTGELGGAVPLDSSTLNGATGQSPSSDIKTQGPAGGDTTLSGAGQAGNGDSSTTRQHPERIDSTTTPSALPSVAVTTASSSVASLDPLEALPLEQMGSASPMLTPTQIGNGLVVDPLTPRPRGASSATSRTARTRSDFYFGDLIGEGSYSTVIEAWDLVTLREKGLPTPVQSDGDASNALAAIAGKAVNSRRVRAQLEDAKVYAIKVLDKVHILKEKKQKYVNVEKEALSMLTRHPGVITLYWTFQDRDSLYFVLEMAPNGELLSWIKKMGSFSEACACYYAAQLLDTIQSIHKAGVLHRDVKPENVLLDAEMRIRLADFGSAKVLKGDEARTDDVKQRPSSFVGTAEYVSPELLVDKRVSKASDYWAMGCIVYQMLCGRPPFKGASEYQTFQKIMRREFEFHDGFSADAKDFVDSLLCLDPLQRPTPEQMRSHAFFRGINWSALWTGKVPELEAGMYKRTPASSAEASALPSLAQGSSSSRNADDAPPTSENDGEDEADDDERSLQSSAAFGHDHASRDATGAGDDADDDDTSGSESQHLATFRRRGFSAGASVAERMMTQVSNSTRRGGNNLLSKVTSGLASLDRIESGATSAASSRGYRGSFSSRPAVGETADEQTNSNGTREERLSASLATSWAALLLPNESLLYACPVLHKTAAQLLRSGTKKRQLLLTDFPRLLCVKETNDQLKVKSEVILGIPKLFATPNVHGSSPTPSGGVRLGSAAGRSGADDSTSTNRSSMASQMRRESSAGPLLLPSSPTSTAPANRADVGGAQPPPSKTSNAPTPSTPPHEQSRRRESSQSVLARQQQIMALRNSHSDAHLRVSLPANAGVSGGYFVPPSPLNPSPSSRQGNMWATDAGVNHAPPFMDVAQASPNVMTSIEARSIKSFVVHTPARSYLYEDPSGDASHWIKSITTAARQHGAATTPRY